MRIATRFTAGTLLPLVLLLAALAYNISQMSRLAKLPRELAAVDLRATTLSLELGRTLLGLDEFSRKLSVTGDPQYAERVEALQRSFDRRLEELQDLDLETAVREQVDRLALLWRQRSTALRGARAADADTLDPRPEVERLRRLCDAITTAHQATIAERVARADIAARRAERLSWLVAAAAVAAGAVLILWSVASLRGALRRLTAGTRSVAEGELSVRIDDGGTDEFATVRSSFNEMVRRLSERETEKRDFVNKLSHDLRTPLSAVAETTRLLLDEGPGPLVLQQRQLLELNLEAATRTSGMVSKLLQMARMEARATRYDIDDHDLGEVARQACAAFTPRASESGHHLVVIPPEDTISAVCDREQILQVMENLIDNALKFAPAGSAVVVRVRPGTPGELPDSPANRPLQAAVIEVVDAGPGVPDEEKERIFDKYHQIGSHQKTGEGIGLGLAICREIAQAHRGRVRVVDNPEGGSVFSLALPRSPEPARLAERMG